MIKIGIPRSLFYYYDGQIWIKFFEYLNISYILSPPSNKEIQTNGNNIAVDEMCLALKNYLGHISYLKDKCDYVLIPRIDNYKISNQTCTNFLAAYDIVNNLYNVKILNYNINIQNRQTLKKGLYHLGRILGFSKKDTLCAYYYSIQEYKKYRKKLIFKTNNKLNSNKIKILIVSHPYVIHDELMGRNITKYLEKQDITILYSDEFDKTKCIKESKKLAPDLYFIHAKVNIGSIALVSSKIDGIIFVSAFPCAIDSLANELVMRKIDIPYINFLIDDNSSFTGIETRLESFIDMLEEKKNE